MSPSVHILATVRKPALIDAALLVFRTLRIGFPKAEVVVWGNGLSEEHCRPVMATALNAGCRFQNVPATSHDSWIEALVERATHPFWILDTDVVFWESVEHWFSGYDQHVRFAGRFEPSFLEESTRTVHVERLHTCLMYLNPEAIRIGVRQIMASVPQPWRNSATFPLIRQNFVPSRSAKTMFYDTCAGLWHANMGTPFTEKQDAAFDHLHCATYVDQVTDDLSVNNLAAGHRRIYANIELARGLKKQQDAYYRLRKP